MAVKLLALWCIWLLLCAFVNCQSPLGQPTIWDILTRSTNTSKFAAFWTEVNLTALLQQRGCSEGLSCYTTFAPTNEACDSIEPVLQWAQKSKFEKQKILHGHVLQNLLVGSLAVRLETNGWTTLGADVGLIDLGFGTGRSHQTLAGRRYAFADMTNKFYFINNAQVVQADQQASNGIVQVIKRVLYTPSVEMSFLNYLYSLPNTKISANYWNLLSAHSAYSAFAFQDYRNIPLYSVFFIVTDQGWNAVPQTVRDKLSNNITELANVFSFHYAPNQLVFPGWLNVRTSINFYTGFPADPTPASININQLNPATLSKASSGQITVTAGSTAVPTVGDDVLIKNALVYLVNEPLAFVYDTREAVLARLCPTYLTVCKANANCTAMLNSTGDLTIFAPTDTAMQRLTTLPVAQQTQYLPYTMVAGRFAKAQLTETLTFSVDSLPDAIRFRNETPEKYIEGRLRDKGYVGARITMADQQAVNGVIHVINEIPALPRETVEQYVARSQLYTKYNLFSFVQTMSRGAPYTFLLPTNEAISSMEADVNVGAKILADQQRREYVLRRHTLPMPLLLPDLLLNQPYQVATANYAYTRENISMLISAPSSFRVAKLQHHGVTVDISTRAGCYQFLNGWTYRLPALMYTADDLTVNMCTSRGCP